MEQGIDFESKEPTKSSFYQQHQPPIPIADQPMEDPADKSWLIFGEQIKTTSMFLLITYVKYSGLFFLVPSISVQTAKGRCGGKLTLTNYRFKFEPDDETPEHLVSYLKLALCEIFKVYIFQKTVINFPLGLINKVEKFGHRRYTLNEENYGIQIVCKVSVA